MGEQKQKNIDWRIIRIVIWMLLITWFPFDFKIVSLELINRKVELFFYPYLVHSLPELIADTLLNILFFIPFGALLAAKYPVSSFKKAKILAYGISLSFLIEFGQMFLPTRMPSIFDIGANAVGCLLGGLWSLQLRWYKHRIIGEGFNAKLMRTAAISVLLIAAIFCVHWIQETKLTVWQAAYPMQLTQDAHGEWKWDGEISDIALFAGKTLDVNDLSSAYQYHVNDYVRWVYAAKNSNKFAVKLRLKSHSIQQYGPRHILSNANGYYEGNLIIGQMGDSLTINIATGTSQAGGSNPLMIVPAVFKPGEFVELLIYFDGIRTVVKKNGVQFAEMPFAPEATFWANWNYVHSQNLYLFQRLFWLMIWLPIGLTFGYGWRDLSIMLQIALTAGILAVFFISLWRIANYFPPLGSVFWAVMAAGIGLLLAQSQPPVRFPVNKMASKKERVLA
jgi:glycopeptide antibiotics resistance protein